MTRGHAHAGIEWFERAAAVPPPSRARLGSPCCTSWVWRWTASVNAPARWRVLMEIESDEPDYRDVRDRLHRPRAGGKRAQGMIGLVLIVFFVEVGLVLAVVPWSQFWDRNYFAAVLPMLHVVITNAYVRGAICGLGLVNIVAAASELRSLLAARRLARPGLKGYHRCAR